jgi:hypothetical protein
MYDLAGLNGAQIVETVRQLVGADSAQFSAAPPEAGE